MPEGDQRLFVAVPLPPDAIEEAIRVNGVAVEKNLQAFRRGRQYVTDPAAVLSAAGLSRPAAAETGESPLDRLIRTRSEDLAAYQDDAYARRYLDVVERVRAAERDKTPGSTALTEAVARYLYKLMAYKDEYEVARLHTDGAFEQQLRDQFEGDYKFSFNLAPPILSRGVDALGRPKKRAFGPWMLKAFRTLAKFKFLRGTPLDMAQVDLDSYVVAGLNDHITPWQGCYNTAKLYGSGNTFVLANSGHIQSLINPPSNPKACFWAGASDAPDAQVWLEHAAKQAGSWWPHWREWIKARSCEIKSAPAELGSKENPALAAAPGQYVLER